MGARKPVTRAGVFTALWVAAMALVTASLFLGRKPGGAAGVTGLIVTLMWVVFLVSFSGLTSPGKVRALGAPLGWWAGLALIAGVQVALLHLLLTTLRAGVYLGTGLAALFLAAIVRFMLDYIRAQRRRAAKAAARAAS